MISELIIFGLVLDIVGVLILTRHSDKLLQFLVIHRMTLSDTEESYQKEVNSLLIESQRKTFGGTLSLIVGFTLQIIGIIYTIS